MGKDNQEHLEEVLRRQQVLRAAHEELNEVEADTDAYRTHRSKVFAATEQLLDYEDRIPILLEEHRRQISSRILYAAAGLAAAVMMTAGMFIMAGAASRWYLAPVTALGLAALGAVAAEPRAERANHRGRRAASIVLLLLTVVVAAVMLRLISAFWLLVVPVGLFGAAVCWIPGTGEPEQP